MATSDQQRALEAYGRGLELAEEGRADEALRAFQQAVELFPEFTPARIGIAGAYLDQGKVNEAFEVIDALEVNPDDFVSQMALGSFYAAVEDDQSALQAYAQAERAAPPLPEAYVALAQGYVEMEMPERALPLARRAVEQAPERGDLHLLLGRLLVDSQAFDEALSELRQAAELDPGNADAHFAYGTSLIAFERWEEALAELNRAIALDPHYGLAYVVQGNILAQLGRTEEARKAAKQAEQHALGEPEITFGAAQLYVALGDLPKSRHLLERLIEQDPEDTEARLMLSSVAMNTGDMETAVRQITYLQHHDPELLREAIGANLGRTRKASAPRVEAPAGAIFQLKITLKGSKPPIWRRVLVPGEITLAKLHDVIQAAFGWEDYHLHQFTIDGVDYADKRAELEYAQNEARATLRQVAGEKSKFTYTYDFGDDWEHTILVEKTLPPKDGQTVPVATAGKRAAPPEDSGGIWGYGDVLEALAHPENPEYAELREWIPEGFDPEDFNLAEVNARLVRIKLPARKKAK